MTSILCACASLRNCVGVAFRHVTISSGIPLASPSRSRPRLMASSGESSNNDDWVDLPDQPYPNLQATANSQVTSAGAANAEDRGHSWGLWGLVSWITTSGDSSVDRKDTSVDYVPDANSNMAASAPQDPRKGPSAFMKKAGGAVKKIISKTRIGEPADEQWEFLDHEKEVSLALNPLVLCHVVYMSCMWHAQYQSTESYKDQTYTHV